MRKIDPAVKKAEMTDLMGKLESFAEELEAGYGDNDRRSDKVEMFSTRYSERNAMLIVMQRPSATVIHGYREWLAHGRQVRKGQKGIRILAPAGNAKTIDKVTGEETKGRQFFRLISVFDIAQTEPIEKQSES